MTSCAMPVYPNFSVNIYIHVCTERGTFFKYAIFTNLQVFASIPFTFPLFPLITISAINLLEFLKTSLDHEIKSAALNEK